MADKSPASDPAAPAKPASPASEGADVQPAEAKPEETSPAPDSPSGSPEKPASKDDDADNDDKSTAEADTEMGGGKKAAKGAASPEAKDASDNEDALVSPVAGQEDFKTPVRADKGRRKSAVGSAKSTAKKAARVTITNLDAKPGEQYLVKLKGFPPWPVIIADEDMLPEALATARPVSAKKADGTWNEPFADGGKRIHERKLPIMYLHTNELGWTQNTMLQPLDREKAEEALTQSSKMKKDLKEAFELAAEEKPLSYYKGLIVQNREALAREQEREVARVRSAAAAVAKAKRARSDGDGDLDMPDEEPEEDEDAHKKSKKRKAEEAEFQKKREERKEAEKRQAAEVRKAEEDAARERREAEEREERERAERAATEAAEAEEARAAAAAAMMAQPSEGGDATTTPAAEPPIEDVEMQEENAATTAPTVQGDDTNEANDDGAATTQAQQQPRVVTTIRGEEVDVTELGIDPEYLAALPDEFREEVIAQAVSARRSEARQQAASNPSRDGDFQVFLDALPEQIRREVIQQERQEERRRIQEEQRRVQSGGGTPGRIPDMAVDMDTASILMTLPPFLREQILLEQSDELIDHLPPNSEMLAQARRNLERQQHQLPRPDNLLGRHGLDVAVPNPADAAAPRPIPSGSGAGAGVGAGAGAGAGATDDKTQRRTVIQMLDKSGVATLLRLMFMTHQPDIRQSLFHVFENVCENRQNRLEVISTLVQVLQDGSTDMEAVERTFGQLSLRAKKPKDNKDSTEPKTPVQLRRTLTELSVPASGSGSLSSLLETNPEMSPLLVVSQCLDLLVDLCVQNPHVPWMFLTEHDIPALSLKRTAGKKGKGKDSKVHKFAINSLLSLLERDVVMESSSVMAYLADLLYKVTVPLQTIERRRKDAEEEAAKAEEERVKAAQEAAPEATTSTEPAEGSTTTSASNQAEASAAAAATSSTAATSPTAVTSSATATSSTTDQATTTTTTTAAAAATGPVSQEGSSSTPTAEDAKDAGQDKDKGDDKSKQADSQAKKAHRMIPPTPVIPPSHLNLVVRIFVARECPSKTFQNTISTIKNLSTIPGVKAVIGDELVRQALLLSGKIVADLEQLLPYITNAKSGTDIQGVALNKFSPNASDQNKLLRVLTALDHLFEAKKKPTDEQQVKEDDVAETEKQDLVTSLYDNPTFSDMWGKLGACLGAIRQQENMINVATILLPLIESLMVVCKNAAITESSTTEGQKDKDKEKSKDSEMLLSSPPPDSRMAGLFFTFTDENRRILNELVRNNPKLMSGTFSLLVKNPKVLEFDNKRNYFSRSVRARGAHLQSHRGSGTLNLQVRRDDVFTDSFKSLYYKTGDEIKFGKLNVKFLNEEGIDAGGVTREWFQALSRQMFNADWALFTPVSSDRTTFHPNKLSSINPEHLTYFKFIGRIIAKALYEGRVLDCYFSRAVYKRILGKSVSVKDMESFDPEYYKSLIWMLENDITDIITETFSVEDEAFGVTEVHDLVPNGREIAVTEENKHEYVRLVVEHKLLTSVQEQMQEFLKGFHEIIPADLIAIFGEQELELLISGLPDIDIDDWRANTEYQNYNPSSQQIQWFWRALRSFDKEELAKLLQFVTGTSKVPLNGFKELEGMNGVNRFNIHRDYGNKERLPSSHTCFNQLDLPEYESYEGLRSQLVKAITAGSDYFGFA
jgi:E3 ubiquitin-protein ligase HUWE1